MSTRKTLSGVNSIALVKNSNLDDRAYSDVVETRIGRVRSMYHLLGLLDPEVIALDYVDTSDSGIRDRSLGEAGPNPVSLVSQVVAADCRRSADQASPDAIPCVA
ncbi:hypothetical protein [Archangium sp.]|uniref:hypothetical protein n=1 Tax=Archangium sp. TaxID=1872627 RepID=UPI002D5AB3B9|nr:hypothetical protein [Archangium sp.]HYO55735.1 hypothetical protein [Archangium sp.]